ncbi:MAG: F0F1 ATP synthase subunit A [Armatimonadia bacterium]
MGEHHATWYNAIEPFVPETLRGFINPQTLATYTVLLLLVIPIIAGTRNMMRVPRGWQKLWEWTYEVFRNFAVGVMGPIGEKYLAFLATCFIFIFCMNVLGIIPGFLSPTASINMTAALALTVFVYVQYSGFRAHGFGYLKHFVGEPTWMAPLNIPIHVIGELAKPLSLSIRLFGNIFGEDTVVAELIKLGAKIQQAIFIPIPIHLFMVAFAIFGGFIQALIFTMLTAVYISLALGGHEDHHEEETKVPAHSLEIKGEQVQG